MTGRDPWSRVAPASRSVGGPDARGPSDEALLAAIAAGDEGATVTFVRRYQRRVYGLAVGVLRDPAAAEDVAQEALLRAWRHAPVFDPRRGSVENWLLTITRNLSIDALRRRRDLATDPDELVNGALAFGGDGVDETVETSHCVPGSFARWPSCPSSSAEPSCSRASTRAPRPRSPCKSPSPWAPPRRASAPGS